MPKKLTPKIIKELTIRFGDAFYLLDTDVFVDNYKRLTDTFRNYYPHFNIAYSYKTNYIPRLLKTVNAMGGYAEVVSDLELKIARASGVDTKGIIWNGPVKKFGTVFALLMAGGCVNIDSLPELKMIKKLAEENLTYQINVGIRCNYDVGDGTISRFGFDVDGEEFKEALNIIKKTKNLNLTCLHAHFARRDPKYWTARTEKMLKTYEYIAEQYNLYPDKIDIGGGIFGPMPLELRDQLHIGDITYDDYAKRSAKLFAEHFRDAEKKPTLILEPGSALAGNCMRFVCKVETIKNIRGKYFATTNGSQKNISMNGINPPVQVIHVGGQQKQYKNLDIVGYTCIEGDVLRKDYTGELGTGDYLVFENCGSYSIVMKPPFIFENVPVIDISAGAYEIVKRAESFKDLFSTYKF